MALFIIDHLNRGIFPYGLSCVLVGKNNALPFFFIYPLVLYGHGGFYTVFLACHQCIALLNMRLCDTNIAC
jgi:hypothetical protein